MVILRATRVATAVAIALGLAVAAPFAIAAPAAGIQPCKSAQLTGSFKLVPGSPGAGNVVYRLRVMNVTTSECFVTGVPTLTLLDANGHKLPTKGSFAGPRGQLSAVVVPLGKGHVASLTARFSPDVAGTGESTTGPCEKTAHKLRVTTGSATIVVPTTPPTPVCEHGSLQLGVFTAS